MNNVADYIKAGFRDCPHHTINSYCTHFLQKKVKAEDFTTLYFIEVYVYNFNEFDEASRHRVSAQARLYTEQCDQFGIQLKIDTKEVGGVEKVEQFFAHAYRTLGGIPDPHN